MRSPHCLMSLAACLLGMLAVATTTGAAEPVQGTDYRLTTSLRSTSAPGKIDVVEFFSYACPHCNSFEPAIEAWARTLPADVAFRRVPAPFLMNAENFQRIYYALETMGQVDALQRKIFAAVHVDRLRLEKPEEIAALVGKYGVDGARFLSVFNSFSVATSVTRGKKLVASYALDGVPALAVQGRYVTSPSQAGDGERALVVVDFLVQRARKA